MWSDHVYMGCDEVHKNKNENGTARHIDFVREDNGAKFLFKTSMTKSIIRLKEKREFKQNNG